MFWHAAAPEHLLEISDLLVSIDPETLARRPVDRDAVCEQLRQNQQHGAARYVARLPAKNGLLDGEQMDRLFVDVHVEMQQLHEEFQHGQRLANLLRPMLAAVRTATTKRLRIVDVGCGLGYPIRWLAALGNLGDDVELVGVDLHGALVEAANGLARAERLRCSFQQADAFPPG